MRAERLFAVNVAGFFLSYSLYVFTDSLYKESVPVPAGGLTFLSLNKKVSKEVSQGEALSC